MEKRKEKPKKASGIGDTKKRLHRAKNTYLYGKAQPTVHDQKREQTTLRLQGGRYAYTCNVIAMVTHTVVFIARFAILRRSSFRSPRAFPHQPPRPAKEEVDNTTLSSQTCYDNMGRAVFQELGCPWSVMFGGFTAITKYRSPRWRIRLSSSLV